MATYGRFPQSRLPAKAELLLLVSAMAAEEEAAPGNRNIIQRRDAAKDSAMRAHSMRRSLVHYRCDNSAKV